MSCGISSLRNFLCVYSVNPISNIASLLLLFFDRLKQCFDVARTKTAKVMTLDQFEKDRRSILNGFGEYLIEMASVVIVDQNVVLVQQRYLLVDVHVVLLEALLQLFIVSVGCFQKLNT